MTVLPWEWWQVVAVGMFSEAVGDGGGEMTPGGGRNSKALFTAPWSRQLQGNSAHSNRHGHTASQHAGASAYLAYCFQEAQRASWELSACLSQQPCVITPISQMGQQDKQQDTSGRPPQPRPERESVARVESGSPGRCVSPLRPGTGRQAGGSSSFSSDQLLAIQAPPAALLPARS